MRTAGGFVMGFLPSRISAKRRLLLRSEKEKKPELFSRWKITAAGWILDRSIGSCWKTWCAQALSTLPEKIGLTSSDGSNQRLRWEQRDKKIRSPETWIYSITTVFRPIT